MDSFTTPQRSPSTRAQPQPRQELTTSVRRFFCSQPLPEVRTNDVTATPYLIPDFGRPSGEANKRRKERPEMRSKRKKGSSGKEQNQNRKTAKDILAGAVFQSSRHLQALRSKPSRKNLSHLVPFRGDRCLRELRKRPLVPVRTRIRGRPSEASCFLSASWQGSPSSKASPEARACKGRTSETVGQGRSCKAICRIVCVQIQGPEKDLDLTGVGTPQIVTWIRRPNFDVRLTFALALLDSAASESLPTDVKRRVAGLKGIQKDAVPNWKNKKNRGGGRLLNLLIQLFNLGATVKSALRTLWLLYKPQLSGTKAPPNESIRRPPH
ncbi:hypothetical protein B0H65DRAFT_536878 [Neurospora tetraspora]|uniref:Uncharacterized protein n=1 Tax=Neurospora tetraspora TaxID=94610 RepID=A0AAE0JJQ0_9PEZI|nr:hypothetical protein B0H65DRAFT_536878 [Neurospora tetraspora]